MALLEGVGGCWRGEGGRGGKEKKGKKKEKRENEGKKEKKEKKEGHLRWTKHVGQAVRLLRWAKQTRSSAVWASRIRK